MTEQTTVTHALNFTGIGTALRRWFSFASPTNPNVWQGRLSPMEFRRFAPDDLEQCLELYRINAPGRFPEATLRDYWNTLAEQEAYILVLSKEERVIATGGLLYLRNYYHTAFLCFGLVNPDHQRKGIGTALLLCRLALLDERRHWFLVRIFAVKDSLGFYHRFGFRKSGAWMDKRRTLHPAANVLLLRHEIRRIRKLLHENNVVFPQEDVDSVPTVTMPQWPGAPD